MIDYSELLDSLSKNNDHPHDAFNKFYEWVNKTIGVNYVQKFRRFLRT